MISFARLKWGALAVAAITLLSILPQVRFWFARGSEWRGSYVALQPDEPMSSAYLNALIDGRPLRTDPAAGQDNHPQRPLADSLYSIQFIPPFVIALIARACGLTASAAFIALLAVAAFLASLSLFWLLSSITGDRNFAAVGIIVILCFGALAGGQGLIGSWLKHDVEFLGLPFLRRYVPAAPFPLFFVFCTLIWKALTASDSRAAAIRALLGGVAFGILIFSYFYLWTAALAWLVCITGLWLLFRPADRRRAIRVFSITLASLVLPLGFFFYLLSQRSAELDKTTLLTFTHRPDLFRAPEIIAGVVLVLLIARVWRDKTLLTAPQTVIALSFLLLPFLVFNQQIVTGTSLQPFHYEVFIANYVVLAGLVLAVRILKPVINRRTAMLIVSLALLWATIEIDLPFRAFYEFHVNTDEMVPVLLRLKDAANSDGTWESLKQTGRTRGLVYTTAFGVSELLPTWAPQGTLLAPGSIFFQSLPETERRERLYTHFYYGGQSKEYLRELLNERRDVFLAWRAKILLFGTERVSHVVGWRFQPIRQDEIEAEVATYATFVDSFSREQAEKFPLTYAITPAETEFDFSHLDRWYERDSGERAGAYTLYRLQLRR
jgi:hypothetical protein